MIQYGSHKVLALVLCWNFDCEINKFTQNKYAQHLPWPQYEVHKLPRTSLITNEEVLLDIIYKSFKETDAR